MNDIALGVVRRAIVITGLGAILVSVSEYWFYKVEDEVDSTLILLAYGLLGYLVWAVVQQFHVHSLAGATIASALFGFLIEGVPVPVVYSNPPFSILWTSLAWHAVITIGLGWVLFRYVMVHGRVWQAAALNAGLGILLGVWNAFMWNAQETAGGDELVFVWQPIDAFAMQFLFGYGLFLGGHVMLDRLYPAALSIFRLERLGLWSLAGAISVLVAYGSGLLALFVVLPVLVALCLLVLRKEAQSGSKRTVIDRLYEKRVPLWRFGLSLLIPMGALPIYAALVISETAVEANVFLILTAGPVAIVALIWSVVAIGTRTGQ